MVVDSAVKHAGQVIVDSLKLHGVKRVFSVPGESYLAVLDGLYHSGIENVVCRQEGGAGYMAEAYGKMTGEPGVAMVTRGPGAANAVVAIHAAWQDATPMVLFVGLVATHERQRESFQEFDIHAWFGTQAKRVLVLDEPERASELVAEAFFAAKQGRPGPVIVGLPEDVVASTTDAALHPRIPVADGAVSDEQLKDVLARLRQAHKPLLFVGGGRWTQGASAALTRFAEANQIPVVQDWRASDRIAFDSPVNAGWLGYGRSDAAAALFDEADVVIAVGALPTDVPTDGYKLRQSWDQTTVIVNIDTSLRGRSGPVTSHILAAPEVFLTVLENERLQNTDKWQAWTQQTRQAAIEQATIPDLTDLPETQAGTAHMSYLMAMLVRQLPKDAMYTFGAGNHCIWAQKYLPTQVYPSQLSMRNGSMGYSVPAAVAASLHYPERLVISIAGDGEFGMNGQEIATAVQYGAAMLVIVMDNQQFATIRGHQERHYPDRVSGTQLVNPDFAGLAASWGGYGRKITHDDEVVPALQKALAYIHKEHRPALLHLVADPKLSQF